MGDASDVAVPWLSYLPIPGLAAVAVWSAPDDPLTRFHAWQGGLLVGGLWSVVVLLSLLGLLSDAGWYRNTIGMIVSLTLLAGLVGMVWGAVEAARGRYARIRPAWDLAAAIRP